MIMRYNIHNSNIRLNGDDSVHNKMLIFCNGPSIYEAEGLLTEAASYYLSNQKNMGGIL